MQSVEDFLKAGGSIAAIPSSERAVKKPLSREQIAARNSLTYCQEKGVYMDSFGNDIGILASNQPDWSGCE